MSAISIHAEWLSLMDISGPFLATPVLDTVFPQGLSKLDPSKKKLLRQGYEEWREAIEEKDKDFEAIHQAWIELVLKIGLELDEDDDEENLKSEDAWLESFSLTSESNQQIRPHYVLIDDQTDEPLMLVKVYDYDIALDDTIKSNISQLCRANKLRIALVTNGEQWMLVDAPVGAESTYASWFSRLWSAEPVTLQAFVTLLGIRQFFVDKTEQLPALFDESLKYQDEVTDALGKQVSRAVEVLIQALDRADIDRNRELLNNVSPEELYEAGLTIMMRLVFLLSAEEKGLLLLGDERYDAYYAISSLRMQLHSDSSEILERRYDAWSRLLAVFRLVYTGIEHEALRLPALGSSLFDPDRFPFLEGRSVGTNWETTEAHPLPIDNRTVRLLLDAIQLFQGRTLSYRGLDVEQIGYVYEGLLERTVVRVKEVTLELDATKSSKKPWLTLQELKQAKQDGEQALEDLFKERTGSAISRVRNDLGKTIDQMANEKLLVACNSDKDLSDELKPFFHFIKIDEWGYPIVYPADAFRVTKGNDRGDSGTHYTPKSLTEEIVRETLEPSVYIGPAEGKARNEWQLKSPDELLALKICDPAMGSGAFLVQVCRWLSERLLEAWQAIEDDNEVVTSEGEVLTELGRCEPLSKELDERRLAARRLIAERCLYGVDINPMAVELAKLSIWLITLSKGRPFAFLDHNLRSGDSLLGIHNIEQLVHLHMNPEEGKELHRGLFNHAENIKTAINSAVQLREAVQTCPIRDIHDIETMAQMNAAALEQLEILNILSDVLIGLSLTYSNKPSDYKDQLILLAVEANEYLTGNKDDLSYLRQKANRLLAIDLDKGKASRQPTHWPLVFPEVFQKKKSGFDAIVGNPPFLGGQKITGAMGTAYRNYLVEYIANGIKGSADLVTYFFLQSFQLLGENSQFGLLAVNTIAEGDTRQVGLEQLLQSMKANIYSAYPDELWPGKAAVITSRVHLRKGEWVGKYKLRNNYVEQISPFLSSQDDWSLKKLKTNKNIAFIGSYVLGMGFTLDNLEYEKLITNNKNKGVIYPYLGGKDLNTHPEQKASRYIINFRDWSDTKAREYPDLFSILEERVKPERQELKPNGEFKKRIPLPQLWWQYAEKRPGLYHTIGRGRQFCKHPKNWKKAEKDLKQVIVTTRVSKTGAFSIIENNVIFSDATVVFATDKFSDFSILQSSIHNSYAWKHSSQLKSDMRYTPSDVFETFPFPLLIQQTQLNLLGKKYHALRADIMVAMSIGFTKLYNIFHAKSTFNPEITKLRELHQRIDEEVLISYGWTDLELNHGFYSVDYLPERDNVRFTISEESRLEILRKLSKLNKEMYELEIELSIKPKFRNKTLEKKQKSTTQRDLFSNSIQIDQAFNKWGDSTDDQILAWLEANSGWQPKKNILNGSYANAEEWDEAIKDLLAEKFIEQKNNGESALYRAAT